jgi:hypothetical protein
MQPSVADSYDAGWVRIMTTGSAHGVRSERASPVGKDEHRGGTRRTRRARGAAGSGAVGEAAVIRRLRLPGLVVATVVPLLAVLLPPVSARAAGPGDGAFYAEIHNVYTGKCVNVRNNSTDANAWIQQYWCDHTPADKFYFTAAGAPPGSYEILGQNSHLCITPRDSDGHDGTPLIQWYCTGDRSQLWVLDLIQGGGYMIYNLASGLCMSLPSPSYDDWLILQAKLCADSDTQRWNVYTS